MGMTIYDVRACFTWQRIHARQFTEDVARKFAEMVEGRWCLHPSVNHMHGYPVVLVANDAGCFVQSCDDRPLNNH